MYIRQNFPSRNALLPTKLALVAFFLLAVPARLYPGFHPDLLDGLRGFLITIAIATFISTAIKSRRQKS